MTRSSSWRRTATLKESLEQLSNWLQTHESDKNLAQLFENWRQAGRLGDQDYGPQTGRKARATLVEALIWRRFGPQIVNSDSLPALAKVVALVEGDIVPG